MKKIILAAFLFILLMNLKSATSLSVDICKSGNTNWECELGKTCSCTISGNCTNGNLLVYKTNLNSLLCVPGIYNSFSEINWNNCGNPLGEVKVLADCEEGQSAEKSILVSSVATTTTITTTTTTTTTLPTTTTTILGTTTTTILPTTTTLPRTTTTLPIRTTTTLPVSIQLPCPYQCCVVEEYYRRSECPYNLECCPDHTCKESCEVGPPYKVTFRLILWIVVAVVMPILALLWHWWQSSHLGTTFFIPRKRAERVRN